MLLRILIFFPLKILFLLSGFMLGFFIIYSSVKLSSLSKEYLIFPQRILQNKQDNFYLLDKKNNFHFENFKFFPNFLNPLVNKIPKIIEIKDLEFSQISLFNKDLEIKLQFGKLAHFKFESDLNLNLEIYNGNVFIEILKDLPHSLNIKVNQYDLEILKPGRYLVSQHTLYFIQALENNEEVEVTLESKKLNLKSGFELEYESLKPSIVSDLHKKTFINEVHNTFYLTNPQLEYFGYVLRHMNLREFESRVLH